VRASNFVRFFDLSTSVLSLKYCVTELFNSVDDGDDDGDNYNDDVP
jgi:hypothetical protein